MSPGTATALAIFIPLAVAFGWRLRRAVGAHEDVGVNRTRVRKARKARTKHGLASMVLAGLILFFIAALIGGH